MKEILSSIFFLAVVGILLWGWIHFRDSSQNTRSSQPSIGSLPAGVSSVATDSVDQVAAPQPVEEKKPDPLASNNNGSKDTLNVKVLNGGGLKGSAVKVQDFLKKNGYTAAQAGNATGNYTGTTVYYLGANESNANAIQQLLLKDYPNAQVKIATSSAVENGSASVVVMLGK
jgi:hypothetical protein